MSTEWKSRGKDHSERNVHEEQEADVRMDSHQGWSQQHQPQSDMSGVGVGELRSYPHDWVEHFDNNNDGDV